MRFPDSLDPVHSFSQGLDFLFELLSWLNKETAAAATETAAAVTVADWHTKTKMWQCARAVALMATKEEEELREPQDPGEWQGPALGKHVDLRPPQGWILRDLWRSQQVAEAEMSGWKAELQGP